MKKPLLFTVLPVLMLVSVVVLGAGCLKEQETVTPDTNTNGIVEDSNAANTNEAETNVNNVETTNNANNSNVSNTNTDETTANLDTSNWLTYTNEEYGFSFRYPEGWILNDQQNHISLYNPELVGSTYTDSFTIEVIENDFDSYKKQVEDSDLINGTVSISRFNDDIEELNINGLAAKVGTHSTAIGLDEKYYFIPLSDVVALYFEFLKPIEKINAKTEDVIHTLEITS